MRRARNPTWSFVVMRGADKTVKQFSISKRSVFAAPIAAIVAVSGCVAGLQLKAAYELQSLEEKLEKQAAQYTETISAMDETMTTKDDAIIVLHQELEQLTAQAEQLKIKVQELQELELQLKTFIETYGSKDNNLSKSLSDSSTRGSSIGKYKVKTLSAQSTGRHQVTPDALSSENAMEIAALAQNTSLDVQALSDMVETMGQSMGQTLKQAQTKRMVVDAYPSLWPTRSKQLTSGFGYRRDPFTGAARFHAGIDISGKSGDTIFSAADGTVSETGFDNNLGNYVIIDHLGGLQSAYMHLKQIDTKEGEAVVRGERIGLLGSSGRSTGPHLHFQIMQKSEPVNPLKFLAKRT